MTSKTAFISRHLRAIRNTMLRLQELYPFRLRRILIVVEQLFLT
jgi:hypothetical protein